MITFKTMIDLKAMKPMQVIWMQTPIRTSCRTPYALFTGKVSMHQTQLSLT